MNPVVKGALQGAIPTLVLVGGTHHLVKKFRESKPVLYWGSLAVATGVAVAIVQGRIPAPFMKAETFGSERIHGDERLDRWVENNYGDDYDWALLNEYDDEWDDAYDILEDFIVLDDDGNEHKGIAIIYREEYDDDDEDAEY